MINNVIDIHTHIIPGVDDGCKDDVMCLAMLRKAVASGTQAIFATSHAFSAAECPVWDDLLAGVQKVRKMAQENNLKLKIYSGSEVFMDWELLPQIANNGSYCLNGEHFGEQPVTYILVELPMHFIPQYADEFWYELRLKGVTPILAHPERYQELMTKTAKLLQWRKEGLLLQCNAGSFAGKFGESAEHAAKILLKNNLVDFLGSDAHRDVGRNTDMREGIKVICELAGDAAAQRILLTNPQKLVTGEKVDVFVPEKIAEDTKKCFWIKLFDKLRK